MPCRILCLLKMDVEAGKVLNNNDSNKIITFTDLGCVITNSRLLKKNGNETQKELVILDDVSGAIRPGRLTFILGPSGAGKTTLMKILAGRKKVGVKGSLLGAGRKAVLVAQQATLIDTLTALETLKFAAALKLPNATRRERTHAIETVSKQLGIQDVVNTKTSRLSGGERKRLTIACELLTDPYIMLLDEPTSGLDSVSSMSVVRALRAVASSGRTVACIVHQPSSKLYTSADDIILLANGKTLYAGALVDVPMTIARAGFICPPFYNMADYLLEIASGEHPGDFALLEKETKNYAYEMRTIANNDVCDSNGKGTEAEALLSAVQTYSRRYPASFTQQLGALLTRCVIGAVRDVYLTQVRLCCHILVALLLGALYNGAGDDGARVLSNTSCLFFFLLFLFFSNAMPTIQAFPAEATVVLQEHLNKWYSLLAYCLSKMLIDIPMQLICATVFLIPAWYITSQPMELQRMGSAWLICALVVILAQNFGLVVGTACGVKMGLFVVPASNIPMLMFSEFFIPYKEMPVYLRPLASVSYFRYAFDGMIQSVYGFNRAKLKCNQMFCLYKNPKSYLQSLGLSMGVETDACVILIWIFIMQVTFVALLYFKAYKACR